MTSPAADLENPLQRTAAWMQDRCGCLTASRFAAVYATSKRDGKPLKAYTDLIDELVSERVTGEPCPHFKSAAMQWGIDHEGEAREAYEVETGELVDLVGFVPHPTIAWLGASPDGLVGRDGLLEIKCPDTTTHLRRIRAGIVPEEYRPQMLLQCLCTGRKWVDFVDYDPRLKGEYEPLRLWRIRYTPTKEEKADAIERAQAFLAQVDEELRKLLTEEK